MSISILRLGLGSFHCLSPLHSDDAGYFQLRFVHGRPNKNGTATALPPRAADWSPLLKSCCVKLCTPYTVVLLGGTPQLLSGNSSSKQILIIIQLNIAAAALVLAKRIGSWPGERECSSACNNVG